MTGLFPIVLLGLCLPSIQADRLPEGDPAALGLDPGVLRRIDEAIQAKIDEGSIPGAVVLVGRRGEIAHVAALGQRAVEPTPEPMSRTSLFDMASLTKPIATATSVMILVERGKIDLNEPITTYLPEFASHGKDAITVEQLLRHRAGLIPDNPIDDFEDGPESAWDRIAAIDLVGPPGEAFRYSDVGFLILGRLVERVSSTPLDVFARDAIFEPLGMVDTTFLPLERGVDVNRIAPTERDGETFFRGVVHDPRSRALGGVAGHAGLFSTADDVALYAQMLLNGGMGSNGVRILEQATVSAMIDAGETPENQRRGLGWDVETGYSSPRGEHFGPSSFGHTGFTGTSLWIDPETETFVVLLTSRLHPGGDQPSPTALRREVATIAAEAIVDDRGDGVGSVRCGIDVLEADDYAALAGKRVGLVTNHTGRTRDGRATIDVLDQAPEVDLVALFSPEHGIRGLLDTRVDDGRDESTGLPIFSLYGEHRKPTPESLEGVDVLVYDIADIGVRFYTYISTLGLMMEAAAEAGIDVVVLDRPNPIGGVEVSGPVRDEGLESFIAYHALPVRHGLTIGELAGLYKAERGIDVDLNVIRCQGWRRSMRFDETGLLWVNPSPNMRSLTEGLLYPGVGLLEATNLATGRGTDTPFERVGAPWIDPLEWASALNAEGLPGVTFVPIRFSPTERQYAGEDCGGVFIAINDREVFEPIALGIGLAVTLRRLYPDDWSPDGLLRLMTDQAALDAIVEGAGVDAVMATWADELRAFRQRRIDYLLYE